MAEATLAAAGDAVGPVSGRAGFMALTGTMTAGGVIVLVAPAGPTGTYYPIDFIDVSRFQQVPNIAGNGYGFGSEWDALNNGGSVKLVASAAFVGSLTGFINVRG